MDYRGEVRVLGLLIVALMASLVLYGGLSTAKVEGSALGWQFVIGGPAGFFVTLVLIFSWRGLLNFKVEDRRTDTLSLPIDKMSLAQAERAIDDFQSDINEIQRKREAIQRYVAKLNEGNDPEAAMAAIGMRPARRSAG